MSAIGPTKPILTMQNIMLKYGRDYRSSHPMPYAAHGVLNAIERCHTPALGAHVIRCQTPLKVALEIRSGAHLINLQREGCQPLDSKFNIVPAETTSLRFTLDRAESAEP
jgi:hypothetical protein